MPTIAYHTLGCKVNQYDTQAMEEILSAAGYSTVPFPGPADIFLINTCTVTGTGDKKCLQLIRSLKRRCPGSRMILCGCMAQLQGEALLDTGADLIIGTQRRKDVADLLGRVLRDGKPICAVEPLPPRLPFEPLTVSSQTGHTRAVLKIQEGCSNRCSYCVIPQVRGPIRSRLKEDILSEAEKLSSAGFCEIVLTGIHLSSYGLDLKNGLRLSDVLTALQQIPGILRIRLGSLEPTVVNRDFVALLRDSDKICPQFHLALQSGSDAVLRRMNRRYDTAQYLNAVDLIRAELPFAAITTDILTGFPGETPEEFQQTADLIRRVGFARIHVFPYSPRPCTPAAEMPGQLSESEKQQRARKLIAIGNETARLYRASWVGKQTVLLPEERVDGCWEGYTPEYIRVRMNPGTVCDSGVPVRIQIISADQPTAVGRIIDERNE